MINGPITAQPVNGMFRSRDVPQVRRVAAIFMENLVMVSLNHLHMEVEACQENPKNWADDTDVKTI